MHLCSHLLSIGLLCGMLSACTTSSSSVDELYRHTEALTALLEKHRSNPSEAVAAIEAYEAEHGEAIDRLIRQSRTIRADLGQRSKRQLRARWEERSGELHKRLERLIERR